MLTTTRDEIPACATARSGSKSASGNSSPSQTCSNHLLDPSLVVPGECQLRLSGRGRAEGGRVDEGGRWVEGGTEDASAAQLLEDTEWQSGWETAVAPGASPCQVKEQAQAAAGLWFSDHAEHRGTGPAPRVRGLLPPWAAGNSAADPAPTGEEQRSSPAGGAVGAVGPAPAGILSRDDLEDLVVRMLEWALHLLRAAEQGPGSPASAADLSIQRSAAWRRAPGASGKSIAPETKDAHFQSNLYNLWSRRTSEETDAGVHTLMHPKQDAWAGWLAAEQRAWSGPPSDQEAWSYSAPGLELASASPQPPASASQRDVAAPIGSAAPVKDLAQPRRKLTLMLRHIPCRVRDADVRELLRRQGMDGKFHSIQVPVDAETDGNLGYAFVVFKSQAALDTGLRVLAGQRFPGCTSDKLTSTEVALGRRPKWASRGVAAAR